MSELNYIIHRPVYKERENSYLYFVGKDESKDNLWYPIVPTSGGPPFSLKTRPRLATEEDIPEIIEYLKLREDKNRTPFYENGVVMISHHEPL